MFFHQYLILCESDKNKTFSLELCCNWKVHTHTIKSRICVEFVADGVFDYYINWWNLFWSSQREKSSIFQFCMRIERAFRSLTKYISNCRKSRNIDRLWWWSFCHNFVSRFWISGERVRVVTSKSINMCFVISLLSGGLEREMNLSFPCSPRSVLR